MFDYRIKIEGRSYHKISREDAIGVLRDIRLGKIKPGLTLDVSLKHSFGLTVEPVKTKRLFMEINEGVAFCKVSYKNKDTEYTQKICPSTRVLNKIQEVL